MLLRRLLLRDFRNLEEVELEFGERFTVLHGHNGAGKTNVLEAVYLVSTLRSFRASELGPLVRHEAPGALVELTADDAVAGLPSQLSVKLERRGSSTRRTASADGKVIRSGAQFYGRIQAILFTPEDLAILRGSPSGRRQFLDRMVFARERAHIGDIQNYEKLVRSRNQVLKREDVSRVERDRLLDTYEAGLSDVGARVWNRRTALVDELQLPFREAFGRIHGSVGSSPAMGGPLAASARYVSKLSDDVEPEARAAALLSAYQERRSEDLRRRVTTVGPHRDDLSVELGGAAAADFASQGQARALVLAFKLAELRAAASRGGAAPLLLLDDVSSELDPDRLAMLFAALADDAGQCILTTTAAQFIALPQGVHSRTWRVDRGSIEADSDASQNGA